MLTPNPPAIILEMAGGYVLPRSLHIVASLGVADALGEEPRSALDLAASVGAHPDALARALRLLAAHGVFEMQGEMFSHTPASMLLRTDHPQSMRGIAQMFGLPICWDTFGEMEESMRTGLPAASSQYPEGFWGYLAQRPDEGQIFNEAMVAKAHGAVAGTLATYDFSRFSTFADIGGGNGHLLRAVLDVAPNAKGTLFELPHVIEGVLSIASDRLALQAGDFFGDQLPAADAYLLMEILHDWGNAESIAILQAVRKAASPGATLLVLEAMVPESPGPDWSKMLDIHMLTLLGGRQRTRQEYESLLTSSGFALRRDIDTGAGVSILEAQAI